jgi:hypothetical protein
MMVLLSQHAPPLRVASHVTHPHALELGLGVMHVMACADEQYPTSISIDYDTDSGTPADVGGGFAAATVRFLIPDFKSRRMTYCRVVCA